MPVRWISSRHFFNQGSFLWWLRLVSSWPTTPASTVSKEQKETSQHFYFCQGVPSMSKDSMNGERNSYIVDGPLTTVNTKTVACHSVMLEKTKTHTGTWQLSYYHLQILRLFHPGWSTVIGVVILEMLHWDQLLPQTTCSPHNQVFTDFITGPSGVQLGTDLRFVLT